MHMRPFGLCAVVLFAASRTLGAQTDSASFMVNDSALVRHIRTTDPVFKNVIESCSEQKLTRRVASGRHSFVYEANCRIRKAPSEASDCSRYAIVASGTVDDAAWATVRSLRLELQCSA